MVRCGSARPSTALRILADLLRTCVLEPEVAASLAGVDADEGEVRAGQENRMRVETARTVVAATRRVCEEWRARHKHLLTWVRHTCTCTQTLTRSIKVYRSCSPMYKSAHTHIQPLRNSLVTFFLALMDVISHFPLKAEHETPPTEVQLGLLAEPGWFLTRLREAVCTRAHWPLHGSLVHARPVTCTPAERPQQVHQYIPHSISISLHLFIEIDIDIHIDDHIDRDGETSSRPLLLHRHRSVQIHLVLYSANNHKPPKKWRAPSRGEFCENESGDHFSWHSRH